MADGDRSEEVPARHLATVQAWRAEVPVVDGPPLDVVVVRFGTDAGDLPPLLVPVDAVAGLVGVLLDASGTGAGDGSVTPPVPSAPVSPVGGPAWATLLEAERVGTAAIDRSGLPSGPGVCAWFRGGVPVHLARAVGKRGLRARIGGDALRGDADPSRSAFRAAVAEALGLVLDQRGGEDRLSPEGVGAVDAWIDGCEVAWLATATPTAATELEATLRAEHDPTPAASGRDRSGRPAGGGAAAGRG